MTPPANPIVLPEWAQFDAAGFRGTLMLVGASDTGKSVLARHLYRQLCRAGARAAYLDTDPGQSTLGLPTTLNVALASGSGDDSFPPRGPRRAYFVGAITPRGHMLPMVVGAHRLCRRAVALGADAVVVDTTGMVDQADGGRALKQWKIELLAPSMVIGLQRSRELEPILWPLRREARVRVVDWHVSPHAAGRSREARIARRRRLLAGYLAQARPHLLMLRQMAVYDLERLAMGALVALQDGEGYMLGLGVVAEFDLKQATAVARSPLPALDGVTSIRFGTVRWDLAGQREL